MYIIKYPDQLIHYGVKGMRWGVRKDGNLISKLSDRRLSKKVAKIEKKRNKALSVRSSAKYTYKQRKYLTDDELRSRINRINMERQLRDLSKTRRGDYGDASLAPLMKSGRQAATKAVGTYGAKMIIAETLGPEAAAFIKPKK